MPLGDTPGKTRAQPALARLRADFQLSIVVLFGAVSAPLILPFGIYRAMAGQWAVAALDAALVLGIAGACGWAWWRGEARRVGAALSVLYTGGALASAEMLGVIGVFWMYAVVVANFFLLRRRWAWTVTLASIGVLLWRGDAFDTAAQAWSFAATALLVGFLAWILANRTEAQRVELEQLATRDALTGVHNRRALTEELALATESMARGGPAAALLLFDLDHFKRINDACGHGAGDAVLVAFCEVLRAHVRRTDRLFRIGGEEFVLLLPQVPASGLRAFADTLRERVRGDLRSPLGPVTVSIGGTILRAGESWEDGLRRADGALYRAKAGGRDRAEVAS
ncbi:MAG: GGDEF domain-containing protein [Xanthomonadaceae bacterium]|jgi:diguanylate cyclase (GGDEF)-like protein|nr:GGDEF domain-containing protein [Xanthomonadaceae bacterium]